MMRTYLLAAGAALAVASVPASAAIVIYESPGAVQPEENVLFPSTMTGNMIFGTTNQTNTQVTFTSDQTITNSQASGQARIEAVDEPLSDLTFFLTDMSSFTEVEFNLFDAAVGTESVFLTFSTSQGLMTRTFDLSNGQNFFGAEATDGDFITQVAFQTDGSGVQDIRQVRIGGIGTEVGAVPEPSTWAMMLFGFGAVGFAMRRRKDAHGLKRVRFAY